MHFLRPKGENNVTVRAYSPIALLLHSVPVLERSKISFHGVEFRVYYLFPFTFETRSSQTDHSKQNIQGKLSPVVFLIALDNI